MKILHISDLHIVADETKKLASELNRGLGDLPFELQLHPANRAGQEMLLRAVTERYGNQLDAIVVTGDLSGFGDDKSLEEAEAFLEKIGKAGLIEDNLKRVIVIPGNHDVLQFTLTAFIRSVESEAGFMVNQFFRWLGGDPAKLAAKLKNMLSDLRPSGAYPIGLSEVDNFRSYLSAGFNLRLAKFSLPNVNGPTLIPMTGRSDDGGEVNLQFALMNTITLTPYMFSAGMINELEATYLALELEKYRKRPTIALTHQGFLAQPGIFAHGGSERKRDIALAFEHSLASLVNGYNLARLLQGSNIELHLHGHEHLHRASCLDFELNVPGALYSFGTAASGSIDHSEFGYNVIRFETDQIVHVEAQALNRQNGIFESKRSDFVVIGANDIEKPTRIARNELHKVFYKPSLSEMFEVDKSSYIDACDDIFISSEKDLLYFGVQLKSVRDKIISKLHEGKSDRRGLYRERFLKGVNFLITGSTQLYSRSGGGKRFVAPTESEWDEFFADVAGYTRIDKSDLVSKVLVRKTDAPLSHAGVIEYSIDDESVVFHRALIQTVRFRDVIDRELYFEVRRNLTSQFIKYYAGTAMNLWTDKNSVGFGSWSNSHEEPR